MTDTRSGIDAIDDRVPPNDLDGAVIVVTGGSRGVGAGIALHLSDRGARVVIAARSEGAGSEVLARMSSPGLVVRCDVTDADQVEQLMAASLDRFGRIDHLIHNATSGRSNERTDLGSVTREQWQDHASVSLRALHRLARAAFPALRRSRGSLLVLTSPAGIEGSETVPLYAAVKGAQRGFVRALAREWGADGIRVNALAPLAVSDALAETFRRDPDLGRRLAETTPLGRVGDPEHDIGPAAAFLCGPSARYVTGQTLIVSGGRFTGL